MFVSIGQSVCEDDRGKIDLSQTRDRGQGKLLVLPVKNCSSVRSIRSTITFRSHMEGSLGVSWETREEQLEEGIHILSGCGATVDLGTVIRVRVPDVDRLVEKEDIAVCIPGVLVVCHARLTGNLTRTELVE